MLSFACINEHLKASGLSQTQKAYKCAQIKGSRMDVKMEVSQNFHPNNFFEMLIGGHFKNSNIFSGTPMDAPGWLKKRS